MGTKSILVTGGAGYIGSHTVNKLIASGYKVTVLDNLSTGFLDAVSENSNFVNADVRDTDTLTRVLSENKIQAVIHFAAKLIVPESITEPTLYYDNNVGGMVSLINACRKNNINKIIFSSTAAVYGNSVEDGTIDETTPTAPLNPYGHSKLMSEQILRDSEIAFGIKNVVLRYFNVAGAQTDLKNGQRTKNATHLVKVAAQHACGLRDRIDIFGNDYPTPDGTGIRDYIHVEDLADLHVLSLKYLEDGNESDLFNCGYGEGYSVKSVLSAMEKSLGRPLNIKTQERRAGDAASLVANSSKIKNRLNWKPKRNDIEAICKTAYEWEMRLQKTT